VCGRAPDAAPSPPAARRLCPCARRQREAGAGRGGVQGGAVVHALWHLPAAGVQGRARARAGAAGSRLRDQAPHARAAGWVPSELLPAPSQPRHVRGVCRERPRRPAAGWLCWRRLDGCERLCHTPPPLRSPPPPRPPPHALQRSQSHTLRCCARSASTQAGWWQDGSRWDSSTASSTQVCTIRLYMLMHQFLHSLGKECTYNKYICH
jgi:hypothetical protein